MPFLTPWVIQQLAVGWWVWFVILYSSAALICLQVWLFGLYVKTVPSRVDDTCIVTLLDTHQVCACALEFHSSSSVLSQQIGLVYVGRCVIWEKQDGAICQRFQKETFSKRLKYVLLKQRKITLHKTVCLIFLFFSSGIISCISPHTSYIGITQIDAQNQYSVSSP